MIEKLRNLYDEYQADAQEARNKSTFLANFFGGRGAAKEHPCHEMFYINMEKWMKAFLASEPDHDTVLEAAWYMLKEPRKYDPHRDDCYWFMYVCVGFIRELIGFMTKEECAEMAETMNGLYPKRDRMPVQEQTYKMLKKAGQ